MNLFPTRDIKLCKCIEPVNGKKLNKFTFHHDIQNSPSNDDLDVKSGDIIPDSWIKRGKHNQISTISQGMHASYFYKYAHATLYLKT